MYTDRRRFRGRRRPDRRRLLPGAAPTIRIPCTRSARACPVGREDGLFGAERDAVALRRRAVGAEAPRGVLVEGRRQRSATTCRSSRCRSTRPSTRSTAACSTRSSRRSAWPSSSPRRASSSTRSSTGSPASGECDFHEDFATPLPSTIFLALMGLPQDDLPQFLRWRDDTIRPQADDDGDRRGRSARPRARRSRTTSRRRSRRSARTPTTGC